MTHYMTLEQAFQAMNPWAQQKLLGTAREYARRFPAIVAVVPPPLRLTLVANTAQVKLAADLINSDVNNLPSSLTR